MKVRLVALEANFGLSIGGINAPPYLRVWLEHGREKNYANITWQIKEFWGFARLTEKIIGQLNASLSQLRETTASKNNKDKLVLPEKFLFEWVEMAKKTKPAIKVEKRYNFGWFKNYLDDKDTSLICDQIIFVRKNEDWFKRTPKCFMLTDIHKLNYEKLTEHSVNCQFCDYKIFLISIGQFRDRQLAELGYDPYDSNRGLTKEEIDALVEV